MFEKFLKNAVDLNGNLILLNFQIFFSLSFLFPLFNFSFSPKFPFVLCSLSICMNYLSVNRNLTGRENKRFKEEDKIEKNSYIPEYILYWDKQKFLNISYYNKVLDTASET